MSGAVVAPEHQLFELQLKLSGRSRESLQAEQDRHRSLIANKAATTAAAVVVPDASKKQYKWSTSIDSAFKFDHSKAVGAFDLTAIDWSSDLVKGVERAAGGSEGLFFVDHVTRGAIIVKRSKALGSEIFCTLLALRLGVRTPFTRVISSTAKDGLRMLTTLVKKDTLGRVASTLYEQNHLILMQYQAGVAIGSAPHERLVAALQGDNLRRIGAIMAFDVLVNNVDRLPLIWDHQGNAGNLMIDDDNEPVAIDGQLVGLKVDLGRGEYMERVRALLSAHAARAPGKASPQFAAVRASLQAHCRVNIGAEGELLLEEGFWSVVEKAAGASIGDELREWAGLLAAIEPPLSDMAQIQPDFVLEVWNLFADAAKKKVNSQE